MVSELAKAKRLVVKVGSGLVTNQGQGLDHAALARWVGQIAELRKLGREIVLVSSGAIAEGMQRLGWKRRPSAVHELQAAAAVGQMGLIEAYESCFRKHALLTSQILLTHEDMADRKRYLNARSTLRTLLDLNLIPIINDKPLESPDEFARLTPEQQRDIEKNQREFAEEMTAFPSKQQAIMRAMVDDVRSIERRFCEALLTPMLTAIGHEMKSSEVDEYLGAVKAHIIDNLDNFKEPERQPPNPMMPFGPFPPPQELFLEYEINVVVDNSTTKGTPVLVESSPTYPNLFGSIERHGFLIKTPLDRGAESTGLANPPSCPASRAGC